MKIINIKKSAEFQLIGKKGKKFHTRTILLIRFSTPKAYLQNRQEGKNAADFLRLGLTASKAVGNAVVRNFAKRRLRHAAQKMLKQFGHAHYDYVIIAKREIAAAKYEKILHDLRFALNSIASAISR